MRKIIIIILGIIFNCFHSQSLTDTENYVYKKTFLSAPSDPVQKQLESVQYLDGLGRPKQIISIKSAPSGKDLVIPVVYDQFGRKTKDYLPVPVQTSNAGIQNTVTESTVNSYYGVTNAFSEKELESSPLNRIFQSASPGDDWKMTSGHTIKYDYDANSESDYVKKYSITTSWDNINKIYISSLSAVSFYEENSLYKFSVRDEDNNEKIVFKDLYGHIILIRKNDGANKLDTYYIYDKYDHLAYVIPPLASVSPSITQAVLDNLCYQYRYDNKKRLVEKKLPGKGWEFMVYNKANKLVMSQDANMKGLSQWFFVKYDRYGRIVYTGISNNTAGRQTIQNAVNANSTIYETRSNVIGFTLSGMPVYYSKTASPTSMTQVLSVNYYDAYPTETPTVNNVFSQSLLTDNITQGRSTKGMPLAGYVKNVEDDRWTKNFSWYDTKGREVITHSSNYLGGYTKTESKLDFAGVPQELKTFHKRLDTEAEKVISETFEYDGQNRLKKHWHQIPGRQKELLSDNTYNDISELVNTKVGGTGANPLQIVDYKYNIRGWLIGINNPNNLGTSLFGYEIKYQNPVNPTDALPKYNGNISEVSWKTANGGVFKRYNYKYDGLDRLKDAVYGEPSVSVPVVNGYGESLTYDLNGNIKTLKRFSAMANTPVLIDNLEYTTYNGNQLIKVVDNSSNSLGYPSGGNTISYDANGNMTSQIDKGFYEIKYNYLDLPNHILFEQAPSSLQNTNLRFLYRADGTKLKKAYTYFVPRTGIWITNETDYLDGFQYTSGGLQFVPTANGYYDFAYNRYVYQYKDQVGNIRLSYYYDGNKIVIDKETNYYPFGMEYWGGNGTYPINRSYSYGFQEQERQEETGWNSFKWRNYDASLGRFFNTDPLSEVYAYQSHYNFSENRVTDAREIEGLEADLLNESEGDTDFASYEGRPYDGGLQSITTYSNGIKEANIQNVDLLGKSSSNQNSFSWGDAGRIGVGFVPIVGSGLDIYEGARDGNWVQFGIGVGGLALDVATLGAGSILKGGVKTIGTELVEQGLEVAAKDVAQEAAEAGSINFMKSNDNFAKFAAKAEAQEGALDVIGHGNPNIFEVNNITIGGGQELINHRVLAKLIKNNPQFVGQDIRLLSCCTGEAKFAQNLANKLKTNVYAPNNILWAHPSGKLTVGAKSYENTGKMIKFSPLKK